MNDGRPPTDSDAPSTEKELRKFIHTVSHDLREPLSKIITISELLMEKGQGLDDASRDYLAMMHRAGKQMNRLLEDLTRSYD